MKNISTNKQILSFLGFLILVLIALFYFVFKTQYNMANNAQKKAEAEKIQASFPSKLSSKTADEEMLSLLKADKIISNKLPQSITIEKNNAYCPNSSTNSDYIIPDGYSLLYCNYYENKLEITLKKENNFYLSLNDFCSRSFYEPNTKEEEKLLSSESSSEFSFGVCKNKTDSISSSQMIFILKNEKLGFSEIFSEVSTPIESENIKLVNFDSENNGIVWTSEHCFGKVCAISSEFFSVKDQQKFSIVSEIYSNKSQKLISETKNLSLIKYALIKEYLEKYHQENISKALTH
ncbi:MAG: hypothetical protein WCX74_03865 [Candidatus Paceibacterota bacterium]